MTARLGCPPAESVGDRAAGEAANHSIVAPAVAACGTTRKRRSAGVVTAISPVATTPSTPPMARAAPPEVIVATRPARRLPSSGPADPTMCSKDATLPRYAAGVDDCTTVPRETTAQVSAPPATASRPSTTSR